MEINYRKIGNEWVDLNPKRILMTSEFINSNYYESYIERGKSNIERYVNDNKDMLSLIIKSGGYNAYALRQLIYHNSNLSTYVSKIQIEGRRFYRYEAMKRVNAAIAPEYANLPEFFREAYSLNDVARSYFNEISADCKNQINKAATAYFYEAMRQYIYSII